MDIHSACEENNCILLNSNFALPFLEIPSIVLSPETRLNLFLLKSTTITYSPQTPTPKWSVPPHKVIRLYLTTICACFYAQPLLLFSINQTHETGKKGSENLAYTQSHYISYIQ